jgi:hypothetical protein
MCEKTVVIKKPSRFAPAAGPRPPQPASQAKPSTTEDQLVQSCFDAGSREQLKPYVAPPALLFITGPPGSVTARPCYDVRVVGRGEESGRRDAEGFYPLG